MALPGIKENAFNRFFENEPRLPAIAARHWQAAVFKVGGDCVYQ
jgi:hypothetical protein